jgi:hypothetical protein
MSDSAAGKKLLIGYFPLFDWNAAGIAPGSYVDLDSWDNLQQQMGENVTVHGIAWLKYPDPNSGNVIPVFIMDDGLAVAKHMSEWFDGDPARFTLMAQQYDGGYAIALVPDPQKSINRWKAARKLYHEKTADDDEFIVCYRQIGVFCHGDRFAKYLALLRDYTDIGFVNKSDFEDQTKNPEMTFLGPFKLVVGDDKHLQLYVSERDKHDRSE